MDCSVSTIFPLAKSLVLLNPKLEASTRLRLEQAATEQGLKNHIWLQSSGTESLGNELKLIALSDEALLVAARGVCTEFNIANSDVYLKALPDFHVSGLSIEARSYVSGCKVVCPEEFKWSVKNFTDQLSAHKVTICSLVPTQVFDLIKEKVKPPKSLRLVFVGGGALRKDHFVQAKQLGWPLVMTYGMTETSAMCGFKKNPDEGYQRFSHMNWKINQKGFICFSSPSIFTAYLRIVDKERQYINTKENNWFESSDRGELQDDKLFVLGRQSDFVKISGESVSITKVQELWNQHEEAEGVVVAAPDERLGHVLVLFAEGAVSEERLKNFNDRLLPFERIRRIITVAEIPRTALGKVKRQELLQHL